jgi:thiosulfate reductase cytochrome b subunit
MVSETAGESASLAPARLRKTKSGRELIYRHTVWVRLAHWINVLAIVVLLMSGLQIFNAYPRLHWGKSSYSGAPPLLDLQAAPRADGQPGISILGHEFSRQGLLAPFRDYRGFPAWATVPGPQWLAMGRRWHFFFAWLFFINGALYAGYSIASRHVSRDLTPTRADWRSIGRSILDHLLLRHPQGEAARNYNVLQKLAYLVVIFVLLPLMIVTGCSMSPQLNSAFAGWVDIFGGRQSARTLHFMTAWLLVLFVLIHVFEVIVTGFWNNLRSMITGRYQISSPAKEAVDS